MHPHDLVFETDSEVRRIVEAKYRALFGAEGRKNPTRFWIPWHFFNVDVDHTVSGELWKLLVNPDDAAFTTAERRAKM
jgi:hypothetical protein